MTNLTSIKEEIVATGRYLLQSGLVVGTWGNISVALPDRSGFIITPSGTEYERTNVTDLVILDWSGQIISGNQKPSSESQLHAEIYQARADIKAIVHTHSTYASAFAVARKAIPAVVEDLAQMNGGTVEIASYQLPGTITLAQQAVLALKDRFAVLLANHGVVGVGYNLRDAVKICQLVEKTAQIFILANTLGQPNELAEDEIKAMHQNFLTSYGQK